MTSFTRNADYLWLTGDPLVRRGYADALGSRPFRADSQWARAETVAYEAGFELGHCLREMYFDHLSGPYGVEKICAVLRRVVTEARTEVA